MSATTKLMTAEELLQMSSDNFRYELVEGELRQMSPAGGRRGEIAAELLILLGSYIKANKLGRVYAAETGFLLRENPDTVRAADVSFLRRERVEKLGGISGYVPGAPDLAVEVISPNDKLTEVEEKVAGWLHYGARLVWIANPKRRTVTDYQRSNQITRLAEADTLDGGDVVPGFRCTIAEVFN